MQLQNRNKNVHFRICLSESFSWEPHVNETIKRKIWSIGILKQLQSYLIHNLNLESTQLMFAPKLTMPLRCLTRCQLLYSELVLRATSASHGKLLGHVCVEELAIGRKYFHAEIFIRSKLPSCTMSCQRATTCDNLLQAKFVLLGPRTENLLNCSLRNAMSLLKHSKES